jgi:hypothetical protein
MPDYLEIASAKSQVSAVQTPEPGSTIIYLTPLCGLMYPKQIDQAGLGDREGSRAAPLAFNLGGRE